MIINSEGLESNDKEIIERYINPLNNIVTDITIALNISIKILSRANDLAQENDNIWFAYVYDVLCKKVITSLTALNDKDSNNNKHISFAALFEKHKSRIPDDLENKYYDFVKECSEFKKIRNKCLAHFDVKKSIIENNFNLKLDSLKQATHQSQDIIKDLFTLFTKQSSTDIALSTVCYSGLDNYSFYTDTIVNRLPYD